MRCSTTDGFHGRSNSTRRRQNSKLRPSPPHSVETSRLGPPASRKRATSSVAPRRRELLVERAGGQLRPVAERGAQHLERLAVCDEHQRLLPARRASAAPAPPATRRADRRRPSPAPARAASPSSGPSTAASAAPDASARRTRSTLLARAPRSLAAGAARTAASTATRAAASVPRSSIAIGMPTRGGSPPMSARRVELVHGGSGVPALEPRLEARVLGKLLGAQQLQQPEEPVRVVLERRRAEQQHVPAERARSARRRATPARRDGPAAAAGAAPRPRPADRCRPPPPARVSARPLDQRLERDHRAAMQLERIEAGAEVARDVGEASVVEQREDLVILAPQLAEPLHGQRRRAPPRGSARRGRRARDG